MSEHKAKVRLESIILVDVREIRENAGISLRQMSIYMDIDKAYYSRMERGVHMFPSEKYEVFNELIKNHGK